MHTYDPEMKYCRICGDEYRSDFDRCAACDTELVSGALLAGRSAGTSGREKAAVIAAGSTMVSLSRGSLLEMKNLKRLLEKSGVAAVITADQTCRGGCSGPQVSLEVSAQDAELAGGLLKAEHASATSLEDYEMTSADVLFNPFAAQTACPACGHIFKPDRPDCPECGLCFC